MGRQACKTCESWYCSSLTLNRMGILEPSQKMAHKKIFASTAAWTTLRIIHKIRAFFTACLASGKSGSSDFRPPYFVNHPKAPTSEPNGRKLKIICTRGLERNSLPIPGRKKKASIKSRKGAACETFDVIGRGAGVNSGLEFQGFRVRRRPFDW